MRAEPEKGGRIDKLSAYDPAKTTHESGLKSDVMITLDNFITGVVSGIVSSTIVGAVFYFLAGRDLKRKSDELRALSILMLRGMEHAGWITLNRDASGQPIGLVFNLEASDGTSVAGTAGVNAQLGAAGTGGVGIGGIAFSELIRAADRDRTSQRATDSPPHQAT